MAIFQKSVINKHLSLLDKNQIDKAYKNFIENYSPAKIAKIKTLKEEEYQDGFLRDIFVNVLGYTLKPDECHNLEREFKNQTDGKKADGAIVKDEKAIVVIELKSTKTRDLKSITQQVFNYKNNQPECKYVITSNFQKLRFYIDYANEFEEFDLFNLSRKEFELFYLILNKDNIFADIPLTLKNETKFHEQEISGKLYKDYSSFKRKLFENLVKNNTADKLTLFIKSQKLLDRFLFILFAEDSGLLPPNSIYRIVKHFHKLEELDAYKPIYDIFKQYFGYMNVGRKGKNSPIDDIPAYNGGLFYADELLDNLKIDDDTLIDDLLNLSKYDFNTDIDVNILGHIFEHSLSEIEEITAEIEDTVTDKTKSKRKKDGVFYTPKYITTYIVENTIGTLCDEKRKELGIDKIEFDETYRTKADKLTVKGKKLYQQFMDYKNWLISLKIVDPACGSGAFLNQTLNYLIQEHKDIDDFIAELTNTLLPIFDIDKTILESNLYGVDINEESIEIAKLSLWLRTAQKGRKLSNLNDNIKCGNSLISDKEVAGNKAFDWNIEFKDIMNNGGFDVVIGNPPYIRNTKLEHNSKEYLNSMYFTAVKQYDLYVLFNELSLKIVKINGLIGFIQPNKFLSAEYGINTLNLIKNNATIIYINNVSLDNIFSDASVYPYIFIFKKKSFNIDFKIENLTFFDICSDNSLIGFEKEISSRKIISKIKRKSILISDITNKITRGVANSKITFEQENGFEAIKSTLLEYQYFLPSSNLKINYKDCKLEEKKLLEFDQDLILLPRTILRIRAVLSNRKAHILDRIYFFKNKSTKINTKTILLILNSKITTFFYDYFYGSSKIGGGYIDLKGTQIGNFPIYKKDDLSQKLFIEKYNLMLDLNKQLQKNKTKFLNRIQGNFEIEKINKKLNTFYDFDFKTFVATLKNKKINLSLIQQDEWEYYFTIYKTKINKLQSKIQQTDNEINQMIYKLYEFTDEEIIIVENSIN
jgi:hypothetical protein